MHHGHVAEDHVPAAAVGGGHAALGLVLPHRAARGDAEALPDPDQVVEVAVPAGEHPVVAFRPGDQRELVSLQDCGGGEGEGEGEGRG